MIRTIGILGSGLMGGGIAQMFAAAGKNVLLWDVGSEILEKGLAAIEKRLLKSVSKGTLQRPDADAVLARLKPAYSVDVLREADLVVEAVVEDFTIKRNLIQEVSEQLREDTVLATNTSSFSVTALSAASSRRSHFLGMHFFNPPTKLELVELVPTAETDPDVKDAVKKMLLDCGKTPVEVKDSPGFIVNRLLLLFINEAARMVEEGVASPEDIDTAMRLGALHPAGPLAVADLIGLDTCGAILNTLSGKLSRQEFEPADIIKNALEQGRLGRKSGSGFFSYM